MALRKRIGGQKRRARRATRCAWLLWSLAMVYGLACLGMPLRAPVATSVPASKDRSQPFPCMDRPCGCQTAEQCWRDCCCFTPQQRAAWAQRHGVAGAIAGIDPPPERAAAARQRVGHPHRRAAGHCVASGGTSDSPCCNAPRASCCSTLDPSSATHENASPPHLAQGPMHASPARSRCCGAPHSSPGSAVGDERRDPPPSRPARCLAQRPAVTLIDALRCGGVYDWLTAPCAVWPAPACFAILLDPADCVPCVAPHVERVGRAPPTPPPRFA
jgi:hypothetical protein